MNQFEYKRGRYTVVINKENLNNINETKQHIVSSHGMKAEDLNGSVAVFTGRGPYSRGQLFKIARDKGCIINTNTITKNTDFLVVGLKPGSKLQKAKALGIKTIMMDDFLKLIAE